CRTPSSGTARAACSSPAPGPSCCAEAERVGPALADCVGSVLTWAPATRASPLVPVTSARYRGRTAPEGDGDGARTTEDDRPGVGHGVVPRVGTGGAGDV